MITINYIDPVWSQVSKEGKAILNQVLYYPYTYYHQGPFHKVSKQTHYPLVSKGGRFLTGFIPRVRDYLNKRLIPYQILGVRPIEVPDSQTTTFVLRPEQAEAVTLALKHQRGVIHYPTGSGKTVIFLSILECLPNNLNALILLYRDHTLFDQTYDRAKEIFPGEVGRIGYGYTEPNRINIANIQTLKDVVPSPEFHGVMDVVIVDECHHVSKFNGEFYNLLTAIPAPRRLGFTGTLPYTPEGKMALEGLIGPIIAEKKIDEVDSLAKPIIRLRKVPFNRKVHETKGWQNVYKLGVVYNSRLNRSVLEEAQQLVKEGRSVLIFVVEVQHISNLMEMASKRFPNLKIDSVWGKVDGVVREDIKNKLKLKLVDVVISNAVWREGIDIPNLGAVINASQNESSIMTTQALGRGLRTTKEKKDVVLVDYFDPSHHYLIKHFGERITLYFDEGWL